MNRLFMAAEMDERDKPIRDWSAIYGQFVIMFEEMLP